MSSVNFISPSTAPSVSSSPADGTGPLAGDQASPISSINPASRVNNTRSTPSYSAHLGISIPQRAPSSRPPPPTTPTTPTTPKSGSSSHGYSSNHGYYRSNNYSNNKPESSFDRDFPVLSQTSSSPTTSPSLTSSTSNIPVPRSVWLGNSSSSTHSSPHHTSASSNAHASAHSYHNHNQSSHSSQMSPRTPTGGYSNPHAHAESQSGVHHVSPDAHELLEAGKMEIARLLVPSAPTVPMTRKTKPRGRGGGSFSDRFSERDSQSRTPPTNARSIAANPFSKPPGSGLSVAVPGRGRMPSEGILKRTSSDEALTRPPRPLTSPRLPVSQYSPTLPSPTSSSHPHPHTPPHSHTHMHTMGSVAIPPEGLNRPRSAGPSPSAPWSQPSGADSRGPFPSRQLRLGLGPSIPNSGGSKPFPLAGFTSTSTSLPGSSNASPSSSQSPSSTSSAAWRNESNPPVHAQNITHSHNQKADIDESGFSYAVSENGSFHSDGAESNEMRYHSAPPSDGELGFDVMDDIPEDSEKADEEFMRKMGWKEEEIPDDELMKLAAEMRAMKESHKLDSPTRNRSELRKKLETNLVTRFGALNVLGSGCSEDAVTDSDSSSDDE